MINQIKSNDYIDGISNGKISQDEESEDVIWIKIRLKNI